jgi:hypothetical protein
MRRARLLTVTAVTMIAAIVPGAARAAATPSVDEACAQASPSAAMCIGLDKLADAAATECRSLGIPDSRCVLPLGHRVLAEARAAYLRSWVHRTVAFQYELGNSLPFGEAQWLGTHNSFNSFGDGPTLSHMDSNQQLTLSQQLDIDIRALELDTHWLPRPNHAGGTVVICHGLDYSKFNGGCTTEPPLTAVLPELDRWLIRHRDQVLLLYLDDNFGPAAAYAETVRDLDTELRRPDGSSLIFRPARSAITPRGCADLPLGVSRQQIHATGAQVIIVANCQSGWSADVFGWDRNHVESGSTPKFKPYPACDATYSPAVYATHLVRYYEDSTFVSAATSPSETPAQYEANSLKPGKVTAMVGCGVNLFGFDQILPDDGRLAATIWSWAPDQPSAQTGACGIERADGRWMTGSCGVPLPAACRTAAGWMLSAPAPFDAADAACEAAGGRFDLPRSGLENSRLHALVGHGEAWLRYQLG